MNTEKEWVYKNQQKVYINNDITRNEDRLMIMKCKQYLLDYTQEHLMKMLTMN
jgi:hypothetical protein